MKLRQYPLAVMLIDTLLGHEEIDPDIATDLLNDVLVFGSATDQLSVVLLMNRHAAHLVTDPGYALPGCLLGDWRHLPPYVRDWAHVVVAKIFLGRPKAQWLSKKETLFGLVSTLACGWRSERDRRLRRDMGAILHAMLSAVPELRRRTATPAGIIDLERAWNETSRVRPSTSVGADTILRIEKWSAVGSAA